jgi:hypothetical protein
MARSPARAAARIAPPVDNEDEPGLLFSLVERVVLKPLWDLHCAFPVPLLGNTMHRVSQKGPKSAGGTRTRTQKQNHRVRRAEHFRDPSLAPRARAPLSPPLSPPFPSQMWTPREGQPFYAAALVTSFVGLGLALRSAAPAAALPPLPPLLRALFLVPETPTAGVPGPETAATTAAVIFFFVLLNVGFAYVNFVTTNRPSLFRGKHGGFRDICIVNLGLPFVLRLAVFVPRVHVHLFLADEGTLLPFPFLTFYAWFLGGLHMTYVTRTGFLAQSISAVDIRDPSSARLSAMAQLAFKLGFIITNIVLHIVWLAGEGAGLLLNRILLYAVFVGAVATVTAVARARYYVHLHHWMMGLVLSPLCATDIGPAWCLMCLGFALSQFVEGAARWSCAPLWHAYPPAVLEEAAKGRAARTNEMRVNPAAAAAAIAEEEENNPSTPLVSSGGPVAASSSPRPSDPTPGPRGRGRARSRG